MSRQKTLVPSAARCSFFSPSPAIGAPFTEIHSALSHADDCSAATRSASKHTQQPGSFIPEHPTSITPATISNDILFMPDIVPNFQRTSAAILNFMIKLSPDDFKSQSGHATTRHSRHDTADTTRHSRQDTADTTQRTRQDTADKTRLGKKPRRGAQLRSEI